MSAVIVAFNVFAVLLHKPKRNTQAHILITIFLILQSLGCVTFKSVLVKVSLQAHQPSGRLLGFLVATCWNEC